MKMFAILFAIFLRLLSFIGANHDAKDAHSGVQLKCLYETNMKDMTWANERLNVITTRTTKPFLMAVLHNDLDRAVSLKLRDHGLWDPQVSGPLQFIVEERPCDKDSIVIDIGANVGFISGLSLSLGCNTAIFEPQMRPYRALEATLCLNRHVYKKLGVTFQLVNHPVSLAPHIHFPSENKEHRHNTGGVGAADCLESQSKCAKRETIQLDAFMLGSFQEQIPTKSTNISRILPGNTIRVLKIDAEGYESDVIGTMQQILSRKLVDNVLFEMMPHILGLESNLKALKALTDAGYHLAESPFAFLEGVRNVHKPYIKRVVPLSLPAAEELVTKMFNEKDHQNWKKKFLTDMWASTDPGIFQRYNAVVVDA